jgi:hypothetical protein
MTLQAMNNAAITLSRMGRLPEAIALARTRYADARSPDHPRRRSLLNLRFYATAGDIPQALALTRECYDRLRGPDNLMCVAARCADFELIAGDAKEGLRLPADRRPATPFARAAPGHRTGTDRAGTRAGRGRRPCRALPLLEQDMLLARGDAKINPRNRATRPGIWRAPIWRWVGAPRPKY